MAAEQGCGPVRAVIPELGCQLRVLCKYQPDETVAVQLPLCRPRIRRDRFGMAVRAREVRRSRGVTQSFAGAGLTGAMAPVSRRAAHWIAALCLALGSSGCLLTPDLPDPALDVPPAYKAAGTKNPLDAPPALDWWRGFRSSELTTLMEEAQTVNLDIAAATARFIQADAQARIAGAPLLPSLSGTGQEAYSRTSGASASGLSIGGREVVNYSASLSASYELDFWGKNRDAAQAAEETAVANRFDRDVVALTTLTSVATAYFQVLASQDRIRTAEQNIASATRILEAIKLRFKAG